MAMQIKNATVTDPTKTDAFGTVFYWRSALTGSETYATKPFIDLGWSVVTARNQNIDQVTIQGNRTGALVNIRTFNKGVSETLTVYSKSNFDSDVIALHAGGVMVTGAASGANAGYGVNVSGLADTATPVIGEAILVERATDGNVLLSYYPVAQLSSDGYANEDILNYPQFTLTALSWGSFVPSAKLAPYIAGASGTKVVLKLGVADLQGVLDDISGHT